MKLWQRIVKWWTEPEDYEMNRKIRKLHEEYEKKNRK